MKWRGKINLILDRIGPYALCTMHITDLEYILTFSLLKSQLLLINHHIAVQVINSASFKKRYATFVIRLHQCDFADAKVESSRSGFESIPYFNNQWVKIKDVGCSFLSL